MPHPSRQAPQTIARSSVGGTPPNEPQGVARIKAKNGQSQKAPCRGGETPHPMSFEVSWVLCHIGSTRQPACMIPYPLGYFNEGLRKG